MGLHIAADCGRGAASFQRLPCQKTKPKGLRCGGGSVVGFGWYYIGGAITLRRYMVLCVERMSGGGFRVYNVSRKP